MRAKVSSLSGQSCRQLLRTVKRRSSSAKKRRVNRSNKKMMGVLMMKKTQGWTSSIRSTNRLLEREAHRKNKKHKIKIRVGQERRTLKKKKSLTKSSKFFAQRCTLLCKGVQLRLKTEAGRFRATYKLKLAKPLSFTLQVVTMKLSPCSSKSSRTDRTWQTATTTCPLFTKRWVSLRKALASLTCQRLKLALTLRSGCNALTWQLNSKTSSLQWCLSTGQLELSIQIPNFSTYCGSRCRK